MSNKNISQSITEAWAKSVAIGMDQSQKKEQKRQQLDETSATLHNKAVQHILENDKGFYRPDTDPFFRKVDGDLLRRQRLAEQQDPMPMEGGADGKESEEVRKEVEKRMAEAQKREEEEARRILDAEEAAAEKEKQDRLDAVYTGTLTGPGGDRAGRDREGLIR